MGARNQEVFAVWLGARFVFGEDESRVEIGEVRLADGTIKTAKVHCADGDLLDCVAYRFFGRYQTHPSYGEQLICSGFVEDSPIDEDSIISYLCQCKGPGKGSITRRVAIALFSEFGFEAIDVVIKSPARAAENIQQWDASKAAMASKFLATQDHKRRLKLDLISLFEGRGFPRQTTERAIKEFRPDPGTAIRRNPYLLMQLPGIGFKGADKLYCELAKESCGTDTKAYQDALAVIHRQGLCACHEVAQERNSTWVNLGMAKSGVRKNISGTRAKPDEAIEWAVANGRLVTYTDQNRREWCANATRALHEQQISWFVEECDAIHDWPIAETLAEYAPEGKPPTDHQVEQIKVALANRIGCLQGSPGTGKTYMTSILVKAIIEAFGYDSIAVACPTGKAAVRATQSLNANDVVFDVRTIHRLLGVESQSGSSWKFHYSEDNPLPYRFLVIDESSMLDTDLMSSLVRACTQDTHILFVGDVNQLAPVGHGRPFQDLQQLVPTGCLTEIQRNSGRIVQTCAEIRDKRQFNPGSRLDVDAGENMPFIELDEPAKQLVAVENIIRRIGSEDSKCSPMWDIQVVTALNGRSEVSRKPLNTMLQASLNPLSHRVPGNPFMIGDKIVCLKNGTYQDAEEKHEEHFVANGELAEVLDLKPGRMFLRLFDPDRQIIVPHSVKYDKASGEDDSESGAKGAVGDWDLGYALSVHRSQGSQWKYVIVVVDSSGSARGVQSRNWLYTAISRAEVATFVLGKISVCRQIMNKDGTSDRKTFLVDRTKHSRAVQLVDYGDLFAKVSWT